MCWIPLILGVPMVVGGVALILRFYRGRAALAPEVATLSRTESLFVGVALVTMGTLVLVLGLTGVICQGLGLA